MARKFPSWVVKAENPRYSAAEYLIFFCSRGAMGETRDPSETAQTPGNG